ncbi:neuromedin-B isoform X3 [Lutra lutra]|uniref:neuromedin-B isoform X3 n=1 Tax=Lutra lutra TaxID=9657 RepID=UPI001FD51602|nr:neuromedin-B isoform X3 [Lutra lutra]
MTLQAGGSRLFGGLLLFALLAAGAAPLSWDPPEPRIRASKIRVHPRGNLWATVQEAAGPDAAEGVPLMRKRRRRDLDCAHPGKVLSGTLVAAPSGCKTWAQMSVTPLL